MDVREKLVELLGGCPCESDCDGVVGSCQNRKYGYCNEIFKLSYCAVSKLAQHIIQNGVTVQALDGCEYCEEYEDLPEHFVSGKPVGRVFDTCIQTDENGRCILKCQAEKILELSFVLCADESYHNRRKENNRGIH